MNKVGMSIEVSLLLCIETKKTFTCLWLTQLALCPPCGGPSATCMDIIYFSLAMSASSHSQALPPASEGGTPSSP